MLLHFVRASCVVLVTLNSCICVQEQLSDDEMSKSASVQSQTPSGSKSAKVKVKKLTPEQLASRRRRLWMMIAKKEIPRVRVL